MLSLSAKHIDIIKDSIQTLIDKERDVYSVFYEEIESYISKHKLIVHSIENYCYRFYSGNAFKSANDLTNLMFNLDHKYKRYVQLKTTVPSYIYSIFVNNRILAIVVQTFRSDKINIYNLMKQII